MKWRSTCRLLIDVIGLAAIVMAALGLMSGRIRSYIPILIDRQLARVWPFTYVVVGDSLAALCPWKWSFGFSPVAVANLAVSGSDIRGITRQIDLADQFRPEVVLISGGLNDLINYEAPLDEIRYDFAGRARGALVSAPKERKWQLSARTCQRSSVSDSAAVAVSGA